MRYTVMVALMALTLAMAMPAGADETSGQPLAPLSSVLEALRQGGFVIYFRHAATDPSYKAVEDLGSCGTQRNLSAKGKVDALRIGRQIQALGIPIGHITASPYCRTLETARLAFGRYTEERDLGFVIGADAEATNRAVAHLRRLLSTPPKPGSNDVIISHSANLYEAAGLFAKPEGAAYVFRPLADGRFEVVARILPEEWNKTAKSLPAFKATHQP